METTMDTTGRRTAATWVAATGAFLLVAAAGVFVSVRWDDIPDAAKLGILFAFTGVALHGGQSLRRTLPATGDVLFHLGAFLLPIDLAATSVRMDTTWGQLLTAEGLLCGIGFGLLAMRTGSVVLRWASTFGVVVLAAGIGATTAVPAAVALVVFAGVAALTRDTRANAAAVCWAAVAGLAAATIGIVAVIIDSQDSTIGGGTIRDLGFAARPQTLTAWAVGFAATAVLAVNARRRFDVGLAFLAIGTAVLGVTTTLASGEISANTGLVAVGGAFLVVELVALALRRDPFWSRPIALVTTLAEVVAVPMIVLSTTAGLMYDFLDSDGDAPKLVALGIAVGVAAIGWLASDLRWQPDTVLSLSMSLLRGGGRPLPNLAFAGTVVSSVVIITVEAVPVVIATVAVAALLVVCGRPLGHLVAAISLGVALWLTPDDGLLILAAVAVCALAASMRARNGERDLAVILTAVAAVGGVVAGLTWDPVVVVPICWAIALLLDDALPRVGDVARLGLVVPLLGALDPLAIGAVLAVLVIDAVASRRVDLADVAAVVAQLFAFAVLDGADVAVPQAGLALCITAIVWSGLAVVASGGWKEPFVFAAVTAVAAGLGLASGDPLALADAIVVTGAVLVAAGLVSRHEAIAHLGGVFMAVGAIGHLGTASVNVAEPYVVLVAAHLALAGWVRRQRVYTSSWIAYVPAIALLGGSALVERVAGGAEWHALVVAGVGTAAVALGGWQRLAGPLLTGTALLVAITAHESLGALAGIPTWSWLAIAGSTLLATGVALERTETSPIDAGRRLVDVIGERFE